MSDTKLTDIWNKAVETGLEGTLKGAKKVLKKTKKPPNNLVESASKEYSSKGKTGIPATLGQRKFSDDYGHTTGELGQGPLKYTIEGRRLDAPFVVGRQSIGKGDKGLREEELFKVAEKIVDKVEAVPRHLLPKGSSGTFKIVAGEDRPETIIRYWDGLAKEKVPQVVAHELGHAIDDLSYRMPREGYIKSLRGIYDDLNNTSTGSTGQFKRPKKQISPEFLGYKGDDIIADMWAEAIRAYMVDPNYLKTVAPKVAKAIRDHTENTPQIRNIIQFNAFAPVGVTGLLAEEQLSQE